MNIEKVKLIYNEEIMLPGMLCYILKYLSTTGYSFSSLTIPNYLGDL